MDIIYFWSNIFFGLKISFGPRPFSDKYVLHFNFFCSSFIFWPKHFFWPKDFLFQIFAKLNSSFNCNFNLNFLFNHPPNHPPPLHFQASSWTHTTTSSIATRITWAWPSSAPTCICLKCFRLQHSIGPKTFWTQNCFWMQHSCNLRFILPHNFVLTPYLSQIEFLFLSF